MVVFDVDDSHRAVEKADVVCGVGTTAVVWALRGLPQAARLARCACHASRDTGLRAGATQSQATAPCASRDTCPGADGRRVFGRKGTDFDENQPSPRRVIGENGGFRR